MRKFLTLLLSLIAVTSLSVYDFKVDHLTYSVLDRDYIGFISIGDTANNVVRVTDADHDVISVAIPAFVTHQGITYTVIEIAAEAFSYCNSLRSVIIPWSVVSVRPFSFESCPSLSSIIVDSNNPKYDSRENCNAIIETDRNMLVVACKGTTIPHSVIRIKEFAFAALDEYLDVTNIRNGIYYHDNCLICARGLSYCVVKEGTRLIADAAFSYHDLDYDTFENEYEDVMSYLAFYDEILYNEERNWNYYGVPLYSYSSGNTLRRVVIPNSVTSVGARAFAFTPLQEIVIPNSVTHIGEAAFYGCDALVSVNLPNSVISLKMLAFGGCSHLQKVNIGDSIKTIEHRTFGGCTCLSNVHIGNGVTHIDRYVFSGCDSLKTLRIPNNVTTISERAIPEHTEIIFEQQIKDNID